MLELAPQAEVSSGWAHLGLYRYRVQVQLLSIRRRVATIYMKLELFFLSVCFFKAPSRGPSYDLSF